METSQDISSGILLTIVVPVYNGAEYISDTVNYILNTNNKQIEVILIDDGSIDSSAAVCEELCNKDSRVRYIYTANGGIAAARNIGISLAKGKYICFCDQDDELVISVYEDLLCTMMSESAMIGICGTGRNINGNKSPYEVLDTGSYSGEAVKSYILYPLLFRGYDYPFIKGSNYLYGTVWKCIFSVDFIKRYNIEFIKFVSYEDDWLFVTQALSYADKVVTLSDIGYYWTVNGKSESHAHKYICDMIEKIDKQDKYVYSYLSKANMSNDILEKYKMIRLCEHYLDLFGNIISADNKYDVTAFQTKVRAYLQHTDYRQQLESQKNLKSTAIKRKCVCNVLKYMGITPAIYVNRILLWCERNAEKIQWIVDWERKHKTSKK